MARLLLHIGAHKTATSYIQRRFHLNRDLLARHGILYPDIGPNRAHHILATPWIDIPEIPESYWGPEETGSAGRTRQDAFFEKFTKDYASRKGTVFLSAEVFSRALPQHVDMADLAKRLSDFEEVKIVYVVRHQTEYIQSIWLQVAKNGKAGRFDPFLAHALQKHLASGIWIDHHQVIENVLSGFSRDQLILLDYETIRKHPEGVIGPFLELLGSPLHVHDLAELDNREANISPDPLAIWMTHAAFFPNPLKLGLYQKLKAALDRIRENHGKKKTSLYTRAQYEAVIQASSEMNIPLRPWLDSDKGESPIFTVPSTEQILFRDDLTEADWAPHLPEGNLRMREKLRAALPR
ncbi:hypothetical protein EYE35_21735 (plasmid) [Cereibacter sphaeroides]|nr:hypothetical protein EYE35_21735 [Cereibacter sphaeroides]